MAARCRDTHLHREEAVQFAMTDRIVLITDAVGFLGSAITVDLARTDLTLG